MVPLITSKPEVALVVESPIRTLPELAAGAVTETQLAGVRDAFRATAALLGVTSAMLWTIQGVW